jgi:hypothetical protein
MASKNIRKTYGLPKVQKPLLGQGEAMKSFFIFGLCMLLLMSSASAFEYYEHQSWTANDYDIIGNQSYTNNTGTYFIKGLYMGIRIEIGQATFNAKQIGDALWGTLNLSLINTELGGTNPSSYNGVYLLFCNLSEKSMCLLFSDNDTININATIKDSTHEILIESIEDIKKFPSNISYVFRDDYDKKMFDAYGTLYEFNDKYCTSGGDLSFDCYEYIMVEDPINNTIIFIPENATNTTAYSVCSNITTIINNTIYQPVPVTNDTKIAELEGRIDELETKSRYNSYYISIFFVAFTILGIIAYFAGYYISKRKKGEDE